MNSPTRRILAIAALVSLPFLLAACLLWVSSRTRSVPRQVWPISPTLSFVQERNGVAIMTPSTTVVESPATQPGVRLFTVNVLYRAKARLHYPVMAAIFAALPVAWLVVAIMRSRRRKVVH